jgi:hypothetical protein
MFILIFSVSSLPDFGCLNALTRQVWNRPCKKRKFAGSLSTHTACCLESRGRVAQFMLLVILPQGQPRLRAIAIQAGAFGVHTEVIRATLPTGNFIATPDSIFQWNTWARLGAAPGNSPV